MKRSLAIALIAALVGFAPLSAMQAKPAASGQPGSVAGKSLNKEGQPVANSTVRLRSIATYRVLDTAHSDASGAFQFHGVSAGQYVVEVADTTGKVLGVTAPFNVAAGQAVAGLSVTASIAATAVTAPVAAPGWQTFLFHTTAGLVTTAAAAVGLGVAVYHGAKSGSK